MSPPTCRGWHRAACGIVLCVLFRILSEVHIDLVGRQLLVNLVGALGTVVTPVRLVSHVVVDLCQSVFNCVGIGPLFLDVSIVEILDHLQVPLVIGSMQECTR